MDIQITTSPARIGIHTTPGKMEIQQPKADMDLNIEHPKVQIETEQIRVQIDQTQCFAEAGLKNLADAAAESVAYGKNKAAQGIDRTVQQGNELAEIHKGGSSLAEQARANATLFSDYEFNFDIVPKSRPKIDFVGGSVNINISEGRVNLEVHSNKPIIDYKRGNLDVYLRQKNSIQIEYARKSLDVKV